MCFNLISVGLGRVWVRVVIPESDTDTINLILIYSKNNYYGKS